MEIIILDSGVYRNHPALIDCEIKGYGLVYHEGSETCVRTEEFEDQLGHGTAVFDLIHRGCPQAEIKAVKIYDNDFALSENGLVQALTYIYENENPAMINLSLGVTMCSDIDALEAVCKQLYAKGVLLLSAFDNRGAISYPAAFRCVYGVTGSSDITSTKELRYIKDSYVNLCAKGTASRLAWKTPDYIFMAGNSFACAMATGTLADKLLKNEIDLTQFPIDTEHMPQIRKPKFAIKKAAIFPFNKEMHSLVRFSYLLPFDIVAIYDHKLTGRVGAKAGGVIQDEKVNNMMIVDIGSIRWGEFDTIILGHMDELVGLTRDCTLREELYKQAMQHQVSIYSFDTCPMGETSFYPQVNRENLPANHFGKLFKIDKPVVGVWGTSSRQGKFTLQMRLREELAQLDYKVGQLGTEPSALLFGIDEVFPYGYNATVNLPDAEAFLYLNRLMHYIARTDCEIILTGGQSAAVSYDLDNISQVIPYQQIFLSATAPDAVVLVVSAHDEEDYIAGTIKYLEVTGNSRVIALAFLPRYIRATAVGFFERYIAMSDNEVTGLKDKLKHSMGLPVYNIASNRDIFSLVEDIIDFF